MFSRKSMRINAEQRLFVDEEQRRLQPVNDNAGEGALSASAIAGQGAQYALPMTLLEGKSSAAPSQTLVWHQQPRFVARLFLLTIALNIALYLGFGFLTADAPKRLLMSTTAEQDSPLVEDASQNIITYRHDQFLEEGQSRWSNERVDPVPNAPKRRDAEAIRFPDISR